MTDRTEVSGNRRRALGSRRWGDSAQVSFAVIAVVLLTASALTGTYIAKKELDEAKAERRERLLDAMDDAIHRVVTEMGLYGAAKALEIVSGWESFPVNESAISESYSVRVESYLLGSYPRSEGRFTVEVSNWTGGLFFVEKHTLDLVPSEALEGRTLSTDSSSMEYADLPEPSAEVMDERTANPYYVALGNFTVRVASGGLALARESSFQRPVISALPFLESKLREFESASEGEFSDMGRLVGYMLSTLGELRIIQGYGQPMYTGMNTSSILSEVDVYRAVAVGTLIEQARLFRAVDPGFEAEVVDLCGGSALGASAIRASRGRSLDPAELFLWFLGETRLELDSKTILAQAVYGLSDQIALKFMEYMGWLGVLDIANFYSSYALRTLESLVSWMTGEDKAKTAVVTWIEKSLTNAGVSPSAFLAAFSSNRDFYLTVPERQYFVEDSTGDLHPVWVGNITAPVDIPQHDLLSSDRWKDFYPQFKECQSTFRSLLNDAVTRLAYDLSSCADLELEGSYIDPGDGVDLFSRLALGSGEVRLVVDPSRISTTVKGLPMFSSQYELSCRLSEFVRTSRASLSDVQELIDPVYSDLASSIVSSARYAYIPDLAVPVEQQLAEMVRTDVEYDSSWGVGSSAASATETLYSVNLERLAELVNSSVARADDGFAGPLVDSIAAMLVSGADAFPGLGKLVEGQLGCFVKGIMRQKELSAYKQSVLLDTRGQFEFWDGDLSAARSSGRVTSETLGVSVPGGMPLMQVVPFDQASGYGSLGSLFPTDNLLVQVKRPWEYDRSRSDYPNVHMTSLSNMTATPYSTQWTVSVLGVVEVVASSENSAFGSMLSDGLEARSDLRIEFEIPVVLHSAWPLQGVDYNPSNTAFGDALDAASEFCEKVWDQLEPVFGWVKDGLERIYKFVTDAFDVLASFATRVIKALTNALQTLVETLQEYIQKLADSALGRAVKVFVDLFGRVEFRITLYGFTIIVQTSIPDLIYRHGSDLLRVIVCTSRLGPSMSFGIRVARLTDGSFDILANATIKLRSGTVEVMVDPLMHILRRFVELHFTGRAWGMDIVMPEVEPYEQVSVSTSDIPGIGAFLSNIPIPALGLSASIEAGMQLKYSPPFPTDVVVNEFESNPSGEDSGKEWVELYNPLARPRCVDGFTLETVHGKSSAIEIKGTIPPNGILVIAFPETSIDNGDPGDPFNDGDAIVLRDPVGATMDITPVMRDTANDERTLQRGWDGGPKWLLGHGSRGGSNGAPILLATSDFIAKALFEAFKEAFLETQLQEVTASLDFLALFAKRVLNHFIENLLSIVKEIIHEVVFYIEVVLSDASGSAGVGFRTSFVVTGEAIVDLLRWLIFSFATFVVNLGKASHPLAYPPFPKSFFSGLFLSFEVLFEVGLPNLVRLLGAVGNLDQKFTLALSVSPNIPALGKVVGRDWGNWSIEFGACIEGVPRDFVNGFLALDTGKFVDFWLVKGRAYGL